jgi:hypothetical protein
MSHAVQLPERAELDVWALHKHFDVACWDTSAATGEQSIPQSVHVLHSQRSNFRYGAAKD